MHNRKKPISALIFDAGDVLVHKLPDDKLKVWKEILTHFQISNLDPQEYFTQLYNKVRICGSDSNSETDFINLPDIPSLNIPIHLIEEYEIEKWWENPDPQLFNTIFQLWKIGYKIGILTDSALHSETIRKLLFSVSPYVHEIVSSRDNGAMKPNPQMYLTILSQLNATPENAVFIAHDPDEIKGALSIGLSCENFETVENLSELVERIKTKYDLITR